jgi:hypothetical protein
MYIVAQNIYILGKGQNVKNQNIKSLKVDKKFENNHNIKSLFLNWSEHQKWSGWSERQKSECQKEQQCSDLFDAIGKIRTSKMFLGRKWTNTFDFLILPMASEKIRTLKIKQINYLWHITYVYQGLWRVRLGSIRLG